MDVVPLDVCDIVLGSPYLYDIKSIFFWQERKYHFTKDGVEYIVRAHGMKDNSSLFSADSMKRIVNSNKNLVLTAIKMKDLDKSHDGLDPCSKGEVLEMGQFSQRGGKK